MSGNTEALQKVPLLACTFDHKNESWKLIGESVLRLDKACYPPDQQYEVTIFMTSSWFGDDFFWFKSRKKSSDAEFYNFYRCEDCLPRDFSSTTALTKPIHTKWSDNKHLQMDVWPTYGECTITLDILEAKQNQNIDCDQNKHVTPSPHQDAG